MTDETIEPSLAETEKIKCPSCFGLGGHGLSNDGGLAERCDTCDGFGTVQPTGGVTSPDYVMVPKDLLSDLWRYGALVTVNNVSYGKSHKDRLKEADDILCRSMLYAAPPSPRSDDGSVEAWKCDGCGHLTTDMVADIKSIRDAGGLSCCPERKMQPLYMSTPHSTAVSAIALLRDVGEPVAYGESYYPGRLVSVALAKGRHHTIPLYLHPTTSPSAIGEEPSSADAVNSSPSHEVGGMVERLTNRNRGRPVGGGDGGTFVTVPYSGAMWREDQQAAALLIALDDESGRMRTALKKVADIIKRNKFHQREKIEDAESIARSARPASDEK